MGERGYFFFFAFFVFTSSIMLNLVQSFPFFHVLCVTKGPVSPLYIKMNLSEYLCIHTNGKVFG